MASKSDDEIKNKSVPARFYDWVEHWKRRAGVSTVAPLARKKEERKLSSSYYGDVL